MDLYHHLNTLPINPYNINQTNPVSNTTDSSKNGYYYNRNNMNIQNQNNHHSVFIRNPSKYIIEYEIPASLLKIVKYRENKEFTCMRYTACTGDPDEFLSRGYTLRQQLRDRNTEIFIAITMYNENSTMFCRTYYSIIKNISYLSQRTKSKVWGREAWKKIVICIISDGREKIDTNVLNVLGCMGVYQNDVMKRVTNEENVVCHIFEYTSQAYVNENGKLCGYKEGIFPVQIIFCLKENNCKKINSHRWFFNAFCPLIQPKICILIDVGTAPTDSSIYHLWKTFDKDPNVAGACGEICVELNKGRKLLNVLVAAQNFEYKMSSILDKPLESILGYISCLPGAFSAYKYEALLNTDINEGPLASYFRGEEIHTTENKGNIFLANMYLAEDRVLCFELVAKKGHNYVLRYVKSAKAYTDAPESLSELVSQRRRWLNGSFFAMIYAIMHWYKLASTSHNIIRIILLLVDIVYQTTTMILSWFSLSSFYLAFHFVSIKLSVAKNTPRSRRIDPFFSYGLYITESVRVLYLLALISVFVLALGNRPQSSKYIYWFAVAVFATFFIVTFYYYTFTFVKVLLEIDITKGVLKLFQNHLVRDNLISFGATLGVYLVSSLLYFEFFHVITCLVQYFIWMPSSINILTVYAFCNIHDISWGTKENEEKNGLCNGLREGFSNELEVLGMRRGSNNAERNFIKFRENLKRIKSGDTNEVKFQTKKDDQNRLLRTNIVLAWVFSNFIVAISLSSVWYIKYLEYLDLEMGFNPYLTFLFWSICGLTTMKFFFSILYVLNHYILGL
ncbi:hypothetical protein BB559_005093 [Furculomyces boomerangus]|uniref:Chitin synthase n=1 Tax=Furculomyces boomerangus TaxID=61424 RepID=A0A2T9YAU4_9FUNG|nr:hypothetical protein BB559_005093 [Furculomyces boomerangus]